VSPQSGGTIGKAYPAVWLASIVIRQPHCGQAAICYTHPSDSRTTQFSRRHPDPSGGQRL